MSFPREMYWLVGSKIRDLRRAQELTQEDFEERSRDVGAEVSRRTLQDVERNIRAVSARVRDDIARVLKVDPKDLVADTVHSPAAAGQVDVEHELHVALPTPKLSSALRQQLIASIRLALSGRPENAARACRHILRQLSKEDAFEEYAAVLVKYVTFLDEAGQHRRALDEIEGLLNDIKDGHRCSKACRIWAEYHKGVCLRRLAAADPDLFPAAANVLKRVEAEGGAIGTAAVHQLAVVYLEEAKTRAAKDAKRLLSKAEPLFRKAHAAWKRETSRSWRQGYPLRRLGQLYALQARHDEALTHYLDALEVFSCHHVLRLVEATKKDIVKWFSGLSTCG